MSRSKKNWDALVRNDGQYSQFIGTKGDKGVKGTVGNKGARGYKGSAATLFTLRGDLALVAQLESNLVEPRAIGDVWKVDQDGKYYAWSQKGWVTLGEIANTIKGKKGDHGIKGEQGGQGSKGGSGERGEKGVRGEKGLRGTSGFQGLKGSKGNPGQTGRSGVNGKSFSHDDFTEEELTELKGEKGEPGERGFKGDSVKGDKGEVYQFADLTDEQKRELVGEKGTIGEKGERGEKGEAATKGAKGENGFGVALQGSVATIDDLPTSDLSEGDLFITEDNYHAYVWDGEGWNDIGAFQGPPGQKGDVGPEGPKGETGPVGIPVGCIMPFTGASAPAGWLLCDGSAIPGGYTALRGLVGANTPNLKGKFLGGAGANGLNLNTAYNDSTSKPLSGLTVTTNTRHRHTFDINKTINTGNGGSHVHEINNHLYVNKDNKSENNGNRVNYTSSSFNSGQATTLETKSGQGSHNHSINLNVTNIQTDYHGDSAEAAAVSGWDDYTRPHTYAVNWIIKHD